MASSASAVALPWRLSGSAASQSAYAACSVSNVPTASRQRWGRLRRRRAARSGDRRGRLHLLARAITGLAFGVAQHVITCRLDTPRHSSVLRYRNALQWIGIHQDLPDALSDGGSRRQAVPRSSCRARGSLASLRGRRAAAAGWGQEDEVSRICPATWRAWLPAGSGLSTRSPRPSSPQERHRSALVRPEMEGLLR